MTRPTIGVFIPARDAASYLAGALRSVVGQDPRPDDVVVVDDGSRDGTAAIAERWGPPVRCLRREGRGPAAARNAGLAALDTDLVASIDADDLWTADSLEMRVAALVDDPTLDAVFGHVEAFTDDLTPTEVARVEIPAGPQPGWLLGTMLARRDVFDRFGLLPEARRGGDMIEWLLHARRAGARFGMLPDVFLRRRIHGANLGRVEGDAMRADYLRIVRAELARTREERAAQGDHGSG
jgi:glycosyltransferase involved in cell wall biosynthesis